MCVSAETSAAAAHAGRGSPKAMECRAFGCVPLQPNALHSVAFGDPQEAWAAAADVSAETHIRYLDRPVRRVLSVIPEKYDDMWTGAKGFYKVEPIVADGGEVVL